MRGPVIAIVADSANPESETRDPERTYVVALAAMTAVLDRGGRVLLAADAALTTSLLIAASTYALQPEIEGGERAAASPVIMAAFPDGDSIEAQLLRSQTVNDEHEELRRSMLEEFIIGNVAEGEGFELSAALRQYQVAAVLAIGEGWRMRPLLADAQRYSRERNVRLVNLTGVDVGGQVWSNIDDRVRRLRQTPPRFEGRTISDENGAEALRALTEEAAEDAALVLAVDAVIGEVLGTENEPPAIATA